MELRAFENQSEKRTHRILEIATKDTLYWVNAKTRLEDVFSPGAGDPRDERNFLRDAHFDYTLHRKSSNEVIWAFEFDGPGHVSDPDAIRRDILKNRICSKANLPLLRIEDDLLEAIDGISLLEWLIRRWMRYEKIIPRMISDRDRAAASMSEKDWDEFRISEDVFIVPPELDVNSLFDLANPYPPLPKTSTRLLKTYGIREGLSLELNPESREITTEAAWELSTCGGPLPDLKDYGLYSRSFCEVQLRRVGEDWLNAPAFAATGEYMARVAYPTFPNQSGLLSPNPTTGELGLCGPPYGGSLWAAGPLIAWHRALREVEKWAAKNLPTIS
ncbi:DUF2726 domain-containing protein [Streptomyces viridochromogenes]|uniref:DUF2726 domain-containing protein n=1 Tax=Streptomyces viridochromogenes TaxID=1938 RepID=UPI00099C491D|nr:DUF2726 domain-containing protein [Streptomyces viridochromogenes]